MNLLELNYSNSSIIPSYESHISSRDNMNYPNILTPPSSSEDSPQPTLTYLVASPTSNYFVAESTTSPSEEMMGNPVHSPESFSMGPRVTVAANIMDTGVSSTTSAPFLRFIEQPTDKFRFRYRSEMAGTHGSLNGINSDKSRKQTFPTVELCNVNCKNAVVRCSIYQVSKSREGMPHAHRLIMKRGKEEYDDPHNITVGPEEGYIAVFHNMGIIHTAKKHLVSELVKKKVQLKKELIARMEGKRRDLTTKEVIEIKGLAESESKSINLNIVCLRFDAFNVINDIWFPICPPIYSHGINNLKSALTGELKIVRMDHCTSPAKGNKEIFVLVERVTKKNVKIRFFELDDNDQEVWEGYGKFTELDVHHQYAIVFKTPEYKNNERLTQPVKVYMELVRPSDNARSEPKEFTYVPCHDRPGAKRPRPSCYTSSSSSYDSSNMASDDIPATVNKFSGEQGPNMNSWNAVVNPENPTLLTSDELQIAINNVNSDEFKLLFESFQQEYLDTPNTISNDVDSHVNEFKNMSISSNRVWSSYVQPKLMIPVSKTKRLLETNIKTGKNKVSSGDIEPQGGFEVGDTFGTVSNTGPTFAVFQSGFQEKVVGPVKMEITDDDAKMAKRTYTELKSFVKSNYTQARAENLLHCYFGAEEKTNALHVFICQNKAEEVNFILKIILFFNQEHLVNVRNIDSQTPLQLAVMCNNEVFVKYIVKCGANVSVTDQNGNTALHMAVKGFCSLEIFEQLLCGEGAIQTINMANNDGDTPLVIAVEKGNMTALKLLCINGADVNKRHNKNGFSPLRFAIEKQNAEIIKYILSLSQLDFNNQNDFGNVSPFVAANMKNSPKEIMDIIHKFLEENNYNIDLKQEEEEESDEEMEEEEVDIKTSIIPTNEVDEKYRNVTNFTSACLDEVSAILDVSGKWEDLADLLDLSHIIRSGIISRDRSISRNLLQFAVEKNNDKILDIRNFLENLDEISAVEVIDRMVREHNT